MSWSMRTWQPPVRRDGPLVVISAFFLLPALFFLTAWYASYIPRSSSMVVAATSGAIALFAPAILCYHLAGRAGRRRTLWAVLVLAGSLLSLWLATQYLVFGGSLPTAAHVTLPDALGRVLATVLVSSVPLLMGMIPALAYGLAVGVDRPLAGVPPRGAVVITTVVGIVAWIGTLSLALLNPSVPPLMPLGERLELEARIIRPAGVPGETVPATWSALFWRLRDGIPPGVTGIRDEGDSYHLLAPEALETLAPLFLGRGTVEFVDAEDEPPASGTQISTTQQPLPGAEETLKTILTGEQFVGTKHWSGITVSDITVQEGGTSSVMAVTLNEEGRQVLQRFSEENPGAFLSLVVDNIAIISFPVAGALESDGLVIRRFQPQTAMAVAAIMRYGPLALVPEFEFVIE